MAKVWTGAPVACDVCQGKIRDYKVAQGGLMRCCIEALDNRADENVPPGQVITCPHCHDSIKLVDGVWRWSSLKE